MKGGCVFPAFIALKEEGTGLFRKLAINYFCFKSRTKQADFFSPIPLQK